jgi:transcription elongation factor GreA
MEYVTKEKAKELEVELKTLKTERRKEIADALEYAKSLGDLSENAEYAQAREAQAQVEERIARIEHILRSAKIVTKHHSSIVEVGSTVHVVKSGTRTPVTYMIVGAEEADTALGKISLHSPLGTSLMGKSAGDTAIMTTPKGEIKYTIKSID